jgi:hypothetical protein
MKICQSTCMRTVTLVTVLFGICFIKQDGAGGGRQFSTVKILGEYLPLIQIQTVF